MRITSTDLPEVLLLAPQRHGDARGFFEETFNQRQFDNAIGAQLKFVQDSHARSARGVLRGLHYQLAPYAQGKLVHAAAGRVFGVAVDMRHHSPRFGHWAGAELNADDGLQMWVPPGFAHGFLVLSDSADAVYKTTDYYAPECEAAVRWNDPAIGIAWPDAGAPPVLSPRDAGAPLLADARVFGRQ